MFRYVKKKIILTAVGVTAAAVVSGAELAKKRFSQGKGTAYRKFLDSVIRFRREEDTAETDTGKAEPADNGGLNTGEELQE